MGQIELGNLFRRHLDFAPAAEREGKRCRKFADDPQTAFELLKPGLAVYAAQVDAEVPAIAKSRNPQRPAGT